MQTQKILETLGFSKKEIAIYLTVLELDSASASEISRKTEINRVTCYDVLAGLMKKGLVSKIKKKGKTLFQTGDPRRLLSYLDREQEELTKQTEQKKKQIQEVMPELLSLMNPKSTKPKVTFYEGEKGMREAYEDTLTSSEEIVAYANVDTMHEGLPNFFPEYYKRRADANVSIKAIIPDTPANHERKDQDDPEKRESVFLPNKEMTFSPEINIYDDKVLIASWKEKMAIIIESKELAELQKLIYKLVWNNLKKQQS